MKLFRTESHNLFISHFVIVLDFFFGYNAYMFFGKEFRYFFKILIHKFNSYKFI